MKYTKGEDWVEINGAHELPMRDLDGLYARALSEAFETAKSVITAWHFVVKGAEVPVGDLWGLPLAKWDWVRDCLLKAARDEQLDPEA